MSGAHSDVASWLLKAGFKPHPIKSLPSHIGMHPFHGDVVLPAVHAEVLTKDFIQIGDMATRITTLGPWGKSDRFGGCNKYLVVNEIAKWMFIAYTKDAVE